MGERYDTVVIGGGSGGLAYAKAAARNGATVALIERDALGGTCVNRGCVPKKLLWKTAHHVQEARRAGADARVDFAALQDRIGDKIAGIRDGFVDDLAEAGVDLIRGTAAVSGPDDVEVDGRTLAAGRLVLANGARPAEAGMAGEALTDTSQDVLSWRSVPESIVILGGGYIGCEFAAIFAALGARVTVVDPSDRLLTQFDADAVAVATAALERQGIVVILGRTPEAVSETGAERAVRLDDGRTLTAARVVQAVGRTPNVDALGPISARLETADSGALAIGDRFDTSLDRVHAIGDAADRLPLTPVATRDGETLAAMLFGDGGEAVDLGLVASAAFTLPPMAQVGSFDGDTVDTSTGAPLEAGVLGGEEMREETQFHKLCRRDGRLAGVALVGEAAPELIAPFAALVGAGVRDLSNATGVHPSFAEEMLGRS
ncbi:NAD(P)/FAD-dependent oxidoreductase [Rhodobacteraceae bacterium CCMM004]|nr:NAD(P)/FAD-dependent oxidoreductase [Rhodobacteraceae bacterium CCMM004]